MRNASGLNRTVNLSTISHVFCGILGIVFYQFFTLNSQNRPEALMLMFHIRVQTNTQLFFGVMAVGVPNHLSMCCERNVFSHLSFQ